MNRIQNLQIIELEFCKIISIDISLKNLVITKKEW